MDGEEGDGGWRGRDGGWQVGLHHLVSISMGEPNSNGNAMVQGSEMVDGSEMINGNEMIQQGDVIFHGNDEMVQGNDMVHGNDEMDVLMHVNGILDACVGWLPVAVVHSGLCI
ncbi:hypothetical protein ABZP36_027339 [Zizania latifolia]